MATEIKEGLRSLQEATNRICSFEIISAHPQSTDDSCNEYIYNITIIVSCLDNFHCISIAFDQQYN